MTMFLKLQFKYSVSLTCLLILTVHLVQCGVTSSAPSVKENLREIEALKKFRKEVSDMLYQPYMKEDKYLITWLRTKDYDIASAVQMLRNNLEWRKRNNIDNILSENWSEFEKHLPYRNDGIAKDGSPLLEIQTGKWSVRKFMLAGKREQYNKYLMRISEHMATKVREQSRKLGNDSLTQHISLYDMAGYNIREHACVACIPAQLQTPRDYEAYFPRAFKTLYFVNTPKVFETLLNLLKPLMAPYTRKVLQIYGVNKNEWQHKLFDRISPDQMLTGYGGTKV